MRNIKIKETYLLFLIVMGLISLAFYSSYALFTTSSEIEDVVDFSAVLTTETNIFEYEMITVPAGEIKTIEVNIVNSYNTQLYYGAWYEIVSGTDIELGIYTERSNVPSSGTIAANSNITLVAGVKNFGEEDAIINIGTVGSLTPNLGLGDNKTLLPEGWTPVRPNSNIININSTNATATFDYTKKSVLLYGASATGAITFSLTETPTSRPYFSDYIINLLGTNTSVLAESTTGNGSTLEKINSTSPLGTSTDYRYRGVNPANYVMFNDELWRVIGVFDSYSHGISNTNLVKLIRNDSIGAYVWDNSQTRGATTYYGTNNFPDSDMYQILNTAYYNHEDKTGEDYCYAYQSSLTGKCDFTKIGIQEEYKRMIEESVTWYLGGNGSAVSAPNFYNYERTRSKYTDNDAITTTTTPIGLMYASDYGYAAPSACTNTSTSSFSSNNTTLGTTCAAQAWLKSNYYEWTITHRSSYSYYVFYVINTGNLNYYYANTGYATRPVLYLVSSVYYLSGTGTQIDPYIIAMD